MFLFFIFISLCFLVKVTLRRVTSARGAGRARCPSSSISLPHPTRPSMESSTVTPASALSAALPPTRLDRPLFIYPLDPDWRRDMRRGVLTLGPCRAHLPRVLLLLRPDTRPPLSSTGSIGFASGFAHGVWKDTWMTLTGLQNFYNVVCTSTAFFGPYPPSLAIIHPAMR